MGKHTLFIEYLNNRKVYAPGDVVEGSVVIDLKKAKKIKRIKVHTIGDSKIKLNHERKQLRNQEKYFEHTFDVYQGTDSEIAAGQHKFSFRFQLKTALPTSFEGTLGHVRYSIEAVVEYPGLLSTKMKCLSAFTVLDTVDLNASLNARQPQRIFCEKKASGMCCWRKPAVTVNITTEKTGYVPGEFIIVNGIIANGRSKPIKSVSVELQQQVTFYGRHKNLPPNAARIPHTVNSAVATWNLGSQEIREENTETWQRKSLMQIPPLIPTGLKHCTIIDVQYYLRIVVVVPGSITGTEISGRSNFLTIGTVPLMAPVSQQAPVPQLINRPAGEEVATAPAPILFCPDPSAPPPPYEPGNSALASVPLPSYQEAVTGGALLGSDAGEGREENEELVSPDTQFTPQYTFFDFSQPAFNPAFQSPPLISG